MKGEALSVPFPPFCRDFDAARPIEIARGQCIAAEHLLRCALKDHFSTLASCLRTDINDIICSEHHILVVLDNDDGVATVAELLQALYETNIVALMESDAGLIEDIEDIDQLRAYLRGKPYALAFAAREGLRGARETEIVKTNIQEEAQARADFFQDFCGDGALTGREVFLDSIEEIIEFAQVHRTEFSDVLPAETIGEGFAVQARAVTVRAFHLFRELLCPTLSCRRHFYVCHLLHIFRQTIERKIVVFVAARGGSRNTQALATAVDDFIDSLLRQFLKWRIAVCIILLQYCFHFPENQVVAPFPERFQGSLANAFRRVGTHFLNVHGMEEAQTFAFRASSESGIEGKDVRRRLAVGNSRDGTHQTSAEIAHLLRCIIKNEQESVALIESFLHRLPQALSVFGLHTEFINDDFYVVGLIAVEFHTALYGAKLAIDADMNVAFAQHGLEDFAIMALAVLHQRGEEIDAMPIVVAEYHIHNLLFRIFHHRLTAKIRVGGGGAGVEKTEKIIDLRDGTHSGTRIFVRRLLLNTDDGRQSGDFINIGSLQISEKISGIG